MSGTDSSHRLRTRRSTPALSHLHRQNFFTADPASPPETPTTSPQFSRKSSLKPFGDGHQFSYQPTTLGPEQLSPRSPSSPSSSVAAVEDDDDDDDAASEDASPSDILHEPELHQSRYQPFLEQQAQTSESSDEADDESGDDDDDEDDLGSDMDGQMGNAFSSRRTVTAALLWDFIIEEVSSLDGSLANLEILRPYEIEMPRSRSGSFREAAADDRTHRDLDGSMMDHLRNLNCSNEGTDSDSSSEEPGDFDAEENVFLRRQQELRRLRRLSMSSSVGKRTHSELSDSDDDVNPLDVNEAGSSARRLRKRLHRTSLLFNDPPEQIDELEEPNSSEGEDDSGGKTTNQEHHSGRALAQELPYWTMEIMEIASF